MGGRAACSCLPDMAGDPQTGCHPECTLNSDCAPHMVCLNQHCVDPCALGHICGLGAKCTCRDHTASCVCHEGFTGDPFIQCIPIREFLNIFTTTASKHKSCCFFALSNNKIKHNIVCLSLKNFGLLFSKEYLVAICKKFLTIAWR